jgi:nucleotide-binding universal stress UspA family protein
MIKKILLGADLGPFTSHMLLHIDALVTSFDARLHVVHAVPPLGELASAVLRSHCSDQVKKEVLGTTHVTGLLETIREEIFEAFTNSIYTDNNLISRIGEVVVAPGSAANIILYEAERSGADLIVIGSHGTESIDGRLLGSVAAKVLQLSKIPVLMIPMMDPANMIGNTRLPLPSRRA